MAREPISAYQYYMSINDTAKAANYDSAAADGSEENPYAIRDWYDIYNVYHSKILSNSGTGHSYILVNDIDFNKISSRRLNVLQKIEGIPQLVIKGFFDFNGHSFKNIIFRNISGSVDNNIGTGNTSGADYLGCLIDIYCSPSVNAAYNKSNPTVIKNVKIENFIINESYPVNDVNIGGYYRKIAAGCSIFYINHNRDHVVIIENTDINVTYNITNYAKDELRVDKDRKHFNLYSCGLFRFAMPYQVLFKNVFVKFSGIVKHAFAVDGEQPQMYPTCAYPLNILCPNGGNTLRNNTYDHDTLNAQYIDCTFDFNDFIIQIPINLAYGAIYSQYGFTDKCSAYNLTTLFPYSPKSSDSIHITGHLQFLLPTKEEIEANPLSFGVLYLFKNSTNTNVLWDARISIMDDVATPNFKIRSSVGTKLFMNKDNIDPVVLENNLMVDDDPSGSGIFMCTTEQLKDEDFLNKNGFFYLRTT